MALISTKNLVAPLTNKVHLTSLILLAVAFAALRFAGGSVAVQRNGDRPYVKPIESRRPVPAPSSAEQTRRGVNNLHNSVGPLGRAPADEESREEQKKQAGGGLAEIEKSLGL